MAARSDISPDTSAAAPRTQQAAHDEETPLLLSDIPSAGGSFSDEENRVSAMISSSTSASASGFSLTTVAPESYLANNSLLAISLSILLVLFGFVLYLVLSLFWQLPRDVLTKSQFLTWDCIRNTESETTLPILNQKRDGDEFPKVKGAAGGKVCVAGCTPLNW
ncbi:hypothetical protein EMPG_12552 [Blastomyces silverae]|uniref:Uncharacterized protein n=1 Tax=Blastomyces silverae TaxID=2060906 RepID=A0A0H1BMS7_9EURO|nr:hypothetical protein EMPG_12552 [Blastomyces silverae]